MIWIELLLAAGFGFSIGLSVGDKWGFGAAKKIWQPAGDDWYRRSCEYRDALMALKARPKKRRRRARSAPK